MHTAHDTFQVGQERALAPYQRELDVRTIAQLCAEIEIARRSWRTVDWEVCAQRRLADGTALAVDLRRLTGRETPHEVARTILVDRHGPSVLVTEDAALVIWDAGHAALDLAAVAIERVGQLTDSATDASTCARCAADEVRRSNLEAAAALLEEAERLEVQVGRPQQSYRRALAVVRRVCGR